MTAQRSRSRWGIGLVVAFALFVAAMLAVTTVLMMQDVNLVTDRYYEQELVYQQRRTAVERVRATGKPVGVDIGDGMLRIQLPAIATPGEADGHVRLYRPSDRSVDRAVVLALDTAWQQRIPAATLLPGLWRVQIQWTVRGVEYYYEQRVLLP